LWAVVDRRRIGETTDVYLRVAGRVVRVAFGALRGANSITEGKQPRGGATAGGRPPQG
jgi:hypothetical protein